MRLSNISLAINRLLPDAGGVLPPATDPYFDYVSLLLNTTATNGAQNNTFLDSSTNNFTITRNGDVTQGSFTPYMPDGYWGAFFDGNGDYLSVAGGTPLNFGTGDFTVEGWAYGKSTATTGVFQISSSAGGLAPTPTTLGFLFNSTGKWEIYTSAGNIISTTNSVLNQWVHFAVVRASGVTKLYINGTEVISTSDTGNYNYGNIAIGGAYSTSNLFVGYVSNIRAVKGTAVYTATFTPPTTPLTAIANTSLLTCQSNRFIDNSSNAFAITRNGDTRISKFCPFSPPASWSAATYGGSGYFDGTGDYLSVADNAALNMGSSDFTLEAWIYLTATPGAASPYGGVIIDKDGLSGVSWSQYALSVDSNRKTVFQASSVPRTTGSPAASITGATTLSLNTWYHVAVTRSGVNATLWVNGVSDGTTASVQSTLNNATRALLIGWTDRGSPDAAFNFPGYISNLRIVKGTAVYTAAFTPPTTPLTAIANTSLLCNFTNAGIYDASTINDGQTVGNAQVSTSVAKWGSTSMAFDGTADYLLFPTRPEYTLGTGDFTIEGWLNVTGGASTYRPVVAWRTSSLATTEPDLYVWNTGVLVWYYNGVARITGTTDVTSAGWVHVAVVRNAGNTKLYVNGTQEGSTYVDANNYPAANVTLKVGANPSVPQYYVGYIDELRITNGIARYTANFTPPTEAFPTS